MTGERIDFKWRWKPPSLRTDKQPETRTPDEFLNMVESVDVEGVDPLAKLVHVVDHLF